jgi:asparagine synthase (glutamine-hydrolysing)
VRYDFSAHSAARRLATHGRELRRTARLSPVARRVRRERSTYLSGAKLQSLEQALRTVVEQEIHGDFVECGVALGGSAIVLASHLDDGRSFHGFDLFATIPPPTERDPAEAHERYARISAGEAEGLGNGDRYYGYMDDLLAHVQASFTRHGVAPQAGRVELHQGLFEDTLDLKRPVALAHIDSDWHDPVALCLERIHSHVSVGGMIVIDDYHDYGGCRTACHEFLAKAGDIEVVRAQPHLVLRRLGGVDPRA